MCAEARGSLKTSRAASLEDQGWGNTAVADAMSPCRGCGGCCRRGSQMRRRCLVKSKMEDSRKERHLLHELAASPATSDMLKRQHVCYHTALTGALRVQASVNFHQQPSSTPGP